MKKATIIGIIGMKQDESMIELTAGAPKDILAEELLLPAIKKALEEHKEEVKDCVAYKCDAFCMGIKDEVLLNADEDSEECKEFMKKFLENPEGVDDKFNDELDGPVIYIGKVINGNVKFTPMDFKLDLDI